LLLIFQGPCNGKTGKPGRSVALLAGKESAFGCGLVSRQETEGKIARRREAKIIQNRVIVWNEDALVS
jgi:hypothetical protein